MALKGTPKEQKSYTKYVGLFTAEVVAVNPNKAELEKLLGTTIDKDPEYTGSNSQNGAKKVTLSFWLKEETKGCLLNVRFGLEDVVMVSKTGKTQFINSVGSTSYAEDKSQLPGFFTENGRTVRPAKKGEELLYKFLRDWTCLPWDDPNTELMLDDWKKLINGNTQELRAAISNYKNQATGALATIRTTDDGKEYQAVYSYEFLPAYAVKEYLNGNKKGYKNIDKFISKVCDREYGCKDYYKLCAFKEYDPTENVVNNTSAPIIKSANTYTSVKSSNAALSISDAQLVDDLPF